MTVHLQREMAKLRRLILKEAAVVGEAIERSIRAVAEGDEKLAHSVIESDSAIDEIELEIEEECLKILALHKPVATDLRFIVTTLKMNNDIERMGDIAESIARRALHFEKHDIRLALPDEFTAMTGEVRAMVRQSLDALVNSDAPLAIQTCRQGERVHQLHRRISDHVREEIQAKPKILGPLMKLLDLARHFERIADLATNIAEDVVYLVRGEIVRHKSPHPDEETPAG